MISDTHSVHFLVQQFFRLTNLRRLTLSDNDFTRIPAAIGHLTKLVELDVSKNGKLFVASYRRCRVFVVICRILQFRINQWFVWLVQSLM